MKPSPAPTSWTTPFVVQAAAPGAQRLTLTLGGREQQVLIDVDSGSWAALHEQDGRWTVRQDGPEPLWDAVEDQLGRWRASGTPPLEQLAVHIAPEGQTIRW